MKKFPWQSRSLISAVVINTLIASTAFAADTGQLDLDIFIVDENASPSEVINRIELPSPTSINTAEVPAPQNEADIAGETRATIELQTTLDSTVEAAIQTVTDTINDAISSGDVTVLSEEIKELIPEEEIDKIIDGIDTGQVDDLSDGVEDLTGLEGAFDLDVDTATSAMEDLDTTLEEDPPLDTDLLPVLRN